MNPFDVLRLVISNLQKLGIPYMVVGSFAGAAHGLVRSTFDADFIVDLRPEHIRSFLETFERDFFVDPGQVKAAVRGKRSFNIIHLQATFKADLFVLTDTPFAQEEFRRRLRRELEVGAGPAMYVASAEDTVLSKLACYRQGGEVSEQQWRDVLGILKVQASRLDLDYLGYWAAELGVRDLLLRGYREAGTPNKPR